MGRPSSGFTILELLVVISIIAILLGILLPAYMKVRDTAKETKARVTAKNLEIAFKGYLDYYRTWPSAWSEAEPGQEIQGDMFRILRGETVGADNRDKVVFYEFESTNSTTGALDPWSDPADSGAWRRYRVRADADYDNKINVGGQDIYRSVIVWSCGTNRNDDGGTGDDIKSWE